MDPVSQILSQSGAGSAQGEGFGQYFAQGMRMGQDQQQLNLARRRLEFEEDQQRTMLPLQQHSMILNNQRMGLQIQSAMKEQERQNIALSKMPELLDLHQRFAMAPLGFQDNELMDAAQTIFRQAPELADTEVGRGILTGISEAPRINQAFETFKKLSKIAPEGSIPQSYDPKTGRVTFMKEQAPPRGNIIRTLPDGTTEVIMGANVNDLTPNQRGNARQQVMRMEDTARRISDIIPKVGDIFGPLAATQTIVADRALANLAPGLADGQRIQGRAAAGMIMEGMIRSLSEGQGALSNQDVQRLTAKFPELNNPGELFESPERAKQILTALQKELSRDAYQKLRLLNDAPSDEILGLLDPMFALQEFQAGRLSKEQYQRAINSSAHPDDVNRLLEEARRKKAGNGR